MSGSARGWRSRFGSGRTAEGRLAGRTPSLRPGSSWSPDVRSAACPSIERMGREGVNAGRRRWTHRLPAPCQRVFWFSSTLRPSERSSLTSTFQTPSLSIDFSRSQCPSLSIYFSLSQSLSIYFSRSQSTSLSIDFSRSQCPSLSIYISRSQPPSLPVGFILFFSRHV